MGGGAVCWDGGFVSERRAVPRHTIVPLSPRWGLHVSSHPTHGWGHGLYSDAASRLFCSQVLALSRRQSNCFRPAGACTFLTSHPRLAPWAVFLRRFAAVLLASLGFVQTTIKLHHYATWQEQRPPQPSNVAMATPLCIPDRGQCASGNIDEMVDCVRVLIGLESRLRFPHRQDRDRQNHLSLLRCRATWSGWHGDGISSSRFASRS